MYAIIQTGGKQYRVQDGDIIYVEKLDVAAEAKIVFDKVLSIGDGETIIVGSPYLEGAVVEGNVVKNGKGKKIMVFKYNAKKNYRRRQGHRQPYTKIQISKISNS